MKYTVALVVIDGATGELSRYHNRDEHGVPIRTHYADGLSPTGAYSTVEIVESFRRTPHPALEVDKWLKLPQSK